ncbi:hypothetical protein [Pararcticibacter amylolyticus]|uniref:Peptidase S74 domain-containing protein n=1 Tax=Pararcticibacter amylolyticus TaxID=2173175 RepID=A0A2U2PC69_9SPHI|nr:hypothetical protein [Pararcticibacter amylolyticus]PWG78960.1 hypothetical protein DDR33_20125 [Pararcticibacter amylolyticus]
MLVGYQSDNTTSVTALGRDNAYISGNLGLGTLNTGGYKLAVSGKACFSQFPFVVGDQTNDEYSVRFSIFYDNSMNNTIKYINFGKDNSLYNCGEIGFTHVSDNASSNFVTLGMYGQLENQRLYLFGDGNLGVGTKSPKGYKLAVAGPMIAESVKVQLQSTWPDYVFSPEHKLPALQELEHYIQENQHLPGMPSASEVKNDGIDLGRMNAALLKKVEELTLYIIEQNKELKEEKQKNHEQQKRLQKLEDRLNDAK